MDNQRGAGRATPRTHRCCEVSTAAHAVIRRKHRVRQRDERGPCGAARTGSSGQRECACAAGIRGSWPDGGCWAGTYASTRRTPVSRQASALAGVAWSQCSNAVVCAAAELHVVRCLQGWGRPPPGRHATTYGTTQGPGSVKPGEPGSCESETARPGLWQPTIVSDGSTRVVETHRPWVATVALVVVDNYWTPTSAAGNVRPRPRALVSPTHSMWMNVWI